MTDTVTGEVTWVDIAGSGELVNGLTTDVPYSFEVYSVNAVGEQCPRSSPTAVATPVGIEAG